MFGLPEHIGGPRGGLFWGNFGRKYRDIFDTIIPTLVKDETRPAEAERVSKQ